MPLLVVAPIPLDAVYFSNGLQQKTLNELHCNFVETAR